MDSRTVVDLVVAVAALGLGAAIAAYARGIGRRHDRATIAALQRVLTNPLPTLAGISIGSALRSASPGLEVGGDVIDVFELDPRFVLLLVADVSGRGVAAAAQTAFIKYTIRTLAVESDGDPAVVLAKFNALYAHTIKDIEAFAVVFLGIIDRRTGDIRYASAGHEPAYIRRRGGSVRLLAPTGPIVGAARFCAYSSAVVTLAAGDVLVCTTDGLTESRDRNRRLLGADGLAGWIAGAPDDPRGIVDRLVTLLQERSGGSGEDDIAILAVAYDAPASRERLTVLPSYRFDSLPSDFHG